LNGFPVGQAQPQQPRPALRLISNEELDNNERHETEKLAQVDNPFIDGLSSHLTELWQKARDAKQKVQLQILDDYRRRNGEYAPDKLREIREFGGSEYYANLSNQKCRASEAWLRDVLVSSEDRAFSCDPTPVPDISPEVFRGLVENTMEAAYQEMMATGVQLPPDQLKQAMQAEVLKQKEALDEQAEAEAEDSAEKMETKIADQFEEGNYRGAFEEFIGDLSTTLAAFIKGPIVRMRKLLKWTPSQETGKVESKVEKVFRYEYERVSPLDIFPAPDAGPDIQKCWIFQRHYLSVDDLNAMRGLPGIDDVKLDKIISDYGQTGFRRLETGDHERSLVEGNQYSNREGYAIGIETPEFWGPILGSQLKEWGKSAKAEFGDVESNETYHINAWQTDGVVWKVTRNESPLNLKPYSKTSFEKVPGSFWGRGPSTIIADCQDMCNATARALINNLGQASTFQTIVNDSSRIPPELDIQKQYPGKVWAFKEPRPGTTSSGSPIDFWQPDSRAAELQAVFEHFSTLADQYLGMPQFPLQETNGGGAGGTASGVSMALGVASKGAKRIVGNVDMDITETLVMRQWIANMTYEDDESIKGDITIKARGTNALMVKEQQQLRRQEFQSRIMQDPIAQQLLGIDGYAKLIAEDAKLLDLPLSDLNLDDRSIQRKVEEIEQQKMMQQQQQQMMQEQNAAMQDRNVAIEDQNMRNKTNESQAKSRMMMPDGSPAGGEQGTF